MRIAALYDIHGNLPALEAVIGEVSRLGVDTVVIGGDVVPGPMPRETVQYLRSLAIPAVFIRGNGDRVVIAARRGGDLSEVPEAYRPAIDWNAAQLSDEDEQWLAGWPATLRQDPPEIGGVLFCHATPHNDVDIFTRTTSEERLRPVFASVDAALVFCGHTHMPFDRRVGSTRVVNAGSVGMSFAGPGAFWALLDGDEVRLQRTGYDSTAAADRIRRTRYPQAEQFAANNVLNPPTEAATLEAFSKVELR
jgi:putative phosphoesterase